MTDWTNKPAVYKIVGTMSPVDLLESIDWTYDYERERFRVPTRDTIVWLARSDLIREAERFGVSHLAEHVLAYIDTDQPWGYRHNKWMHKEMGDD